MNSRLSRIARRLARVYWPFPCLGDGGDWAASGGHCTASHKEGAHCVACRGSALAVAASGITWLARCSVLTRGTHAPYRASPARSKHVASSQRMVWRSAYVDKLADEQRDQARQQTSALRAPRTFLRWRLPGYLAHCCSAPLRALTPLNALASRSCASPAPRRTPATASLLYMFAAPAPQTARTALLHRASGIGRSLFW